MSTKAGSWTSPGIRSMHGEARGFFPPPSSLAGWPDAPGRAESQVEKHPRLMTCFGPDWQKLIMTTVSIGEEEVEKQNSIYPVRGRAN